MSKNKKKKKYGSYLEFLEQRVNSENFKRNATSEEYDEAKEKLKREKFKQRILSM